jgi:putative phage-type endonuclease
MSAILLGEHDPNTPEWAALRERGIGASEIAAVVGLSPFESTFSLWHRKKGNLPGPDPANPLFYWGHALEPLVAARFAEDHPEFRLAEIGTHAHEDRSWQIANLDRRLMHMTDGSMSVLEIKTTRYPDNWGPDGSTDIPLHVRCQVMQQMDVFSAPYAWVAVLIGGNDYREYRIPFDEADATALRTAGAAFWGSLETDDEPPIDASWATYEAVRDLHPEIEEDLDVQIDAELHAAYLATKAAADETSDAHRQVKSALLNAMGNARRALIDDTPVLRRQPGRGGSVALYPIKSKDAA